MFFQLYATLNVAYRELYWKYNINRGNCYTVNEYVMFIDFNDLKRFLLILICENICYFCDKWYSFIYLIDDVAKVQLIGVILFKICINAKNVS